LTMTTLNILEQLETSYGKPDMMTLFANDTLFQSPFLANKAPEMLFYRIEQCQEIQILAQDPYSPTQIINNAVRLLQQSGIFPLKDFDTWDAITPKSYPALKAFIHEAYTRCLTALQLHNTTGTQGYAPNIYQNMYNILDGGNDTNSGTEGTVATQTALITQTAAMTTGSTLREYVRGRNNPSGNIQCHHTTHGEPAVNYDSDGSNVIQQRTTTQSSSNLPCSPHTTVEHSHFCWTSKSQLQCRHRVYWWQSGAWTRTRTWR
jgi:hypothetical protein